MAAGWVLVTERDDLDVVATLARHGAIYRWPLPDGAAAHEMAPGQPCFLYATDRSRTVGLWAVGSVVAPPLELDAGTPLLPGEAALEPTPDPSRPRRWAEVELLALDKPLGRAALEAHPAIAASALFAGGEPTGLVPLTATEVKAFESLEFWLAEPDRAQRSALDELLAAEDDLLG